MRRERPTVLVPARPPAAPPPRVVGPGRRERRYLERLAELETHAEEARRELDVSVRVERGTRRYVDRLERRLDDEREASRRHEQAQKRLAVALGALQRENELLRERLAGLLPAGGAAGPRPQARSRGWLARLVGPRSRRRTRA